MLISRTLSSFLLAGLLGLAATAHAADPVRVLMKTSEGDMQLELDAERAPKSVENFLRYVREGFYDGSIFHRVIRGFMIQGGGYDAAMTKKETHEPIENEAKNGLKNLRGTIAMARTRDPHSATSQFFINHADNTNLDYPSFDEWGYAVFGKLVQGEDVLDRIATAETGVQSGMRDVPKQTITIEQVKVCVSADCSELEP